MENFTGIILAIMTVTIILSIVLTIMTKRASLPRVASIIYILIAVVSAAGAVFSGSFSMNIMSTLFTLSVITGAGAIIMMILKGRYKN